MSRVGMRMFLAAWATVAFGQPLKPIAGTDLRVDAAAATSTGVIQLQNAGAGGPTQIELRDWKNDSLKGLVLEPQNLPSVEFSLPGVAAKVQNGAELTIPARPVVELRVDVSNFVLPAVTQGTLYIGGTAVSNIRVVRSNAPFAVKRKDAGTTPQLLRFEGAPGVGHLHGWMTLVNEDPLPYRVRWELRVGDALLKGERLMRPKREEDIEVSTAGAAEAASLSGPWRWWTGFLKDDIRDAHLTLTMDEGGTEQQAWSRAQQSDLRVRLSYHPSLGPLFSNAILVAILFAGAFTSLMLKLTLPNARSRLSLKETLDRLRAQVDDLSQNTGQRLIFFLRVQLKRMADHLDPKAPGGGRNTFSPDFSERVERCTALTKRASRHLDLLTRMDRSVRAMYGLQYRRVLPPSQFAAAEERIVRVNDITVRLDVTDQDIDRIEALVKEIEDLVQKMDQRNCDFMPSIREKLAEVKAFYDPLFAQTANAAAAGGAPPPAPAVVPDSAMVAAANTIKGHWPKPFVCLDRDWGANNISYQTAADLDEDVTKLEVMARYIRLRPDFKANPAPPVAAIYTTALLGKFRANGWDAIRALRRLVSEAERGIVPEDLIEILQSPGPPLRIRLTKQQIRAAEHFEVQLKFDNEDFNGAAAREELKCNFVFNRIGPPPSTRWDRIMLKVMFWKRIWKYFREEQWNAGEPYVHDMKNWNVPFTTDLAGRYKVKCTFEYNGAEITNDKGPVKVEEEFNVLRRPFNKTGPRLRLELISMAVALAPALLALLTTAQTKIAEAEWYTGVAAVFVLGFTVDQLKSLITQRSS